MSDMDLSEAAIEFVRRISAGGGVPVVEGRELRAIDQAIARRRIRCKHTYCPRCGTEWTGPGGKPQGHVIRLSGPSVRDTNKDPREVMFRLECVGGHRRRGCHTVWIGAVQVGWSTLESRLESVQLTYRKLRTEREPVQITQLDARL